MTEVVLDASALIAVMNREPGGDVVRDALAGAVISAVNYSEVLKKTIERCQTTGPVVAFVKGFSIEIVPFEASLAGISADLYLQTKEHGLSFADRACLALGIQRNISVLTTERKMSLLTLPIKVKAIRNAH